MGVAVLLVGIAVLGRGGDGVPATASTNTPTAAVATGLSEDERDALRERGLTIVKPPAERDPAPPVQVETVSFGDGSVFDLGAERGNVVVLFFVAYWCPTCVPEARALAAIHEQYAGASVRIVVLDVDQGSDERLLSQFRERADAGRHLWAIDRDFTVARALNVQLLDTTVVIDRGGRIAYRDGSPTPRQTHLAVLETLLAEHRP